MIKTYIDIHPDESVYSWLSRLYIRSGYSVQWKFFKDIYKREKALCDFIFCGGFNDDFLKIINKVTTYENLVLEHTLLKYYIRFLDLERRKKVYKMAIENNVGIYNFVAVEMKKNNYYLRYCPECVIEDRKKYGECYFHINHMFPRVHVCPKHSCRLIDSDIEIGKYKSNKLIPLEALVKNLDIERINRKSNEFKIAKYINNLFKEDLNFNNSIKIGDYLTSQLNKKYIKKISGNRDIDRLVDELNDFYKDVSGYNMSIGKLQTIYLDRNWNSYEISLVALFEKIDVKCLVDFLNYKDVEEICKGIDWETLDKKLTLEFRKIVDGFNEVQKLEINLSWAAEHLNINKRYIKENLPLLCSEISQFKGKKNNWNKLDEEYCLMLKELVNDDPHIFDGKEVTKVYIGTLLGVRDNSFRRLPKLLELVSKYKKEFPYYKGYHWWELDDDYCEQFSKLLEKRKSGELNFKMSYSSIGKILGIRDLSLKRLPKLRKMIRNSV